MGKGLGMVGGGCGGLVWGGWVGRRVDGSGKLGGLGVSLGCLL